MEKISPKEKANLVLRKHGFYDSEKQVLQILELVQNEEDKNYWLRVQLFLQSLLHKEEERKKIYQVQIDSLKV